MLNGDVISLIRSFAGITSLDVADAVRQLKRERIQIDFFDFKMRDLSQLCFLIKHKFEKKKWNSKKCVHLWDIRSQVGTSFPFSRETFLVAFKLMGYDYKVYDEIRPIGINKGKTQRTFSIAGSPMPTLKWCKILQKIYEKEHGKMGLINLRYSRSEREKCEKTVLKSFF